MRKLHVQSLPYTLADGMWYTTPLEAAACAVAGLLPRCMSRCISRAAVTKPGPATLLSLLLVQPIPMSSIFISCYHPPLSPQAPCRPPGLSCPS